MFFFSFPLSFSHHILLIRPAHGQGSRVCSHWAHVDRYNICITIYVQGNAALLLANLEKEKELLKIFLRVSQMENTVLRRMNLNSFLMVSTMSS